MQQNQQRQHHQQQQQTVKSKTLLASLTAGIVGGSASVILLYPFDLVKVRMQVDERRGNSVLKINNGSDSTTSTNPPRSSIAHIIRGVIRHEGYMGLYRGLTPAVVASAASWGGFFILYEEIKRRMLRRKCEQLSPTDISSNSMSSAHDGSVKNPTTFQKLFEKSTKWENCELSKDVHAKDENYVKSKDQSHSYGKNHSHIQKQKSQTELPQAKLGPIEHFTASCLARACMVISINPIVMIKTRLQLQNSNLVQRQMQKQNDSTRLKPPYRGLFHAAYTIINEEGIFALYSGIKPALLMVSLRGIQFVSYEYLQEHFERNRQCRKTDGGNKRSVSERMNDSLGYLVMGAVSTM